MCLLFLSLLIFWFEPQIWPCRLFSIVFLICFLDSRFLIKFSYIVAHPSPIFRSKPRIGPWRLKNPSPAPRPLLETDFSGWVVLVAQRLCCLSSVFGCFVYICCPWISFLCFPLATPLPLCYKWDSYVISIYTYIYRYACNACQDLSSNSFQLTSRVCDAEISAGVFSYFLKFTLKGKL